MLDIEDVSGARSSGTSRFKMTGVVLPAIGIGIFVGKRVDAMFRSASCCSLFGMLSFGFEKTVAGISGFGGVRSLIFCFAPD